jgi:hypothetical protein
VRYPDEPNDTSRMSREAHVRICGGRRVRTPPATRPPKTRATKTGTHAENGRVR